MRIQRVRALLGAPPRAHPARRPRARRRGIRGAPRAARARRIGTLCSHCSFAARARAVGGERRDAAGGPEPRSADLSIVSNTFHGKLRLYRTSERQARGAFARLQENDTKLPAKNWRLYDVHVGKGGLSGVSVEGEFAKPKKIFVSTATTCSARGGTSTTRATPRVLGHARGGRRGALHLGRQRGRRRAVGERDRRRLYTNELRIDEDLVVEYIAIFQHFDVDANQRISMEELGAVTRALGKSKRPEELPGMCEELGLNVDAMGLTLPQLSP